MKTSILVGAAGLALSGAALAEWPEAFPPEIREGLNDGSISPLQMKWWPAEDLINRGYAIVPLGASAYSTESASFAGAPEGAGGPFPTSVFFIDQYTGSADGSSGTYRFADFTNGINGNPFDWDDQVGPTGNPILTFGGSNHLGVGDSGTISVMGAGGTGAPPGTNGAAWSNGGPPWLIDAGQTQPRNITGGFTGGFSFLSDDLFPGPAPSNDMWFYCDVYRTDLIDFDELIPSDFQGGLVAFNDRLFMGGGHLFPDFADTDGVLRRLANLGTLPGNPSIGQLVAPPDDPFGATTVPTDEWFSIAFHASSNGAGTLGTSVWIKTETSLVDMGLDGTMAGWLDPRMAAGTFIPPDGAPLGWVNTYPGVDASAVGADDDLDGHADGLTLSTNGLGQPVTNNRDNGQAFPLNAALMDSYVVDSGSFDPSDADPNTFPSDSFFDNTVLDGTPIAQPCPVPDFAVKGSPAGFLDDCELWDQALPLRFQGERYNVSAEGNVDVNDFTFPTQTFAQPNTLQNSNYQTGDLSGELPPVPALDQLFPTLGPDGLLFSADDDPIIWKCKVSITSNPGQTGWTLALSDDSVIGGDALEVHFGVENPSVGGGIAQGPAGVGKHIWVRQTNVGGDGVYGVAPGFDTDANNEGNLVEPNWVPEVESLGPLEDAAGPPFNTVFVNIPGSSDGGASKAVLPFDVLTEVEIRTLPNPNQDVENPNDEGVAQLFVGGVKVTPAPGLIQNVSGTFQGFAPPAQDADGDDLWYADSPFMGQMDIRTHNNPAGLFDNFFIDDMELNGPTLRQLRVAGPPFAIPYNDDFSAYPVERDLGGQGDTGIRQLASTPDSRAFGQNSNATTLLPKSLLSSPNPPTVDGDRVCRYLIVDPSCIPFVGLDAMDVVAVNFDQLPDPFDTIDPQNTDCPGLAGSVVEYEVRDGDFNRVGQGEWTLLEQDPILFNSSNEIGRIILPADATMDADGGWDVVVTSLGTDGMGNPDFMADASVGTDPTAPLAAGTTSGAVLDAVKTQLDADFMGTTCTTSRSTSGGNEILTITCDPGDIAICEVSGVATPIDTNMDMVNDAFDTSGGPVDIANDTFQFNGFTWTKDVEGGGDEVDFEYFFQDLNRWGNDANQVTIKDLTGTPQEGGVVNHGKAVQIHINAGTDGFPTFGDDNVLNSVLPEAVAAPASGGDPETTARLEVSIYIESVDVNGNPTTDAPRDRFNIDFFGGRGNSGRITSINFGGPNVNANTQLQSAMIPVLPDDAIGLQRDSGIATPDVKFIDSGISLVTGGGGLTGPLVNKWIRVACEVDKDGNYELFIDEDADDGVDNFVSIDTGTAIDKGDAGVQGIPVNVSSLDSLNIDVGNALGSGGEGVLTPFRIRPLEDFDITTIRDMNGDPVTDSNTNGIPDELELAASVSADLDADGNVGDTADDNTDGFADDADPSDGGDDGRSRTEFDWCIYLNNAGSGAFRVENELPIVTVVNAVSGFVTDVRTLNSGGNDYIAVLNKRRNGGPANNVDGFLIGDGNGNDEPVHNPCPIDPFSPDEWQMFDSAGNLMAEDRWTLTGQAGLAGFNAPVPNGGISLVGPQASLGPDGLLGTGDDAVDMVDNVDPTVATPDGLPDGIAAYNDATFPANNFPPPGVQYTSITLATWVEDMNDGVDPFPVALPIQKWFVDDLTIEEVEGAQPCPGNLSMSTATCPSTMMEVQTVNGADLGILLQSWSPTPGSAVGDPADLNGDGQVDGADLGLLLQAWGFCPGVCP